LHRASVSVSHNPWLYFSACILLSLLAVYHGFSYTTQYFFHGFLLVCDVLKSSFSIFLQSLDAPYDIFLLLQFFVLYGIRINLYLSLYVFLDLLQPSAYFLPWHLNFCANIHAHADAFSLDLYTAFSPPIIL